MGRNLAHNLKEHLDELTKKEPAITEIYIFGSRAYGTGSPRSDCDLIIRADPNQNIKASNLLQFASQNCRALDFFLCTESRAVSVSNDSFVHSANFSDLVARLDAVILWRRSEGFSDFAFPTSGDWTFETSPHVDYRMTVLPDETQTDQAWQNKIKNVEASGLPVRPYIGDTLPKAVAQIVDVIRAMPLRPDQLGQRGSAKTGWTVKLESEYDCQNLFFTVVKPWFKNLGREEVAIRYDDQKKLSDFSLFESQIIIEFKFIDSAVKKAEVIKTLDGLRRFYSQNANVRCLLFVIFHPENFAIDAGRWETDYRFYTTSPTVETIVVPVPV